MEKKYIVYFGAGGAGVSYCKHTSALPDFFLDNDEAKWGTQILGKEILNPASMSPDQVKKLVITSGYIKDICAQLKSLGFSDDVVQIPPKSLLGSHPFKREENRIEAAKAISFLTERLSQNHRVVAVGGTALGFCRQNDFILWDFDIDLFLPLDAKPLFIQVLSEMGAIFLGESSQTSFNFSLSLNSQTIVPVGVDMFDASAPLIVDRYEEYEWQWPTEMFLDAEPVKVHDQTLFVPNPHDAYLSNVYGKTWQQPNPDFSYKDYGGDE